MFEKLFKTHLLILITIVVVLSLILSLAYNKYIFSQKENQLSTAAYKVNHLTAEYYQDEITLDQLQSSINSISYMTESSIYVIESKNNSNIHVEEKLNQKYITEALNKILKGQTVFLKKQYTNKFDMHMVFKGIPLKIDSKIIGAIILFSPVTYVYKNIFNINLIIWIISALLVIISVFIVYFTSSKISEPIIYMEKATSKLAAGEEVEDLEVKSNDELENLANGFNYMKNQILNTEKLRKEFIANISHDLKTPLTSINGFVQAMLDGIIKQEDMHRYLAIIKDEASRLIKLTDDILELTKIQSGTIKLSKQNILVKQILDDIQSSTEALRDEKNISIHIDCPDHLHIYADADRLKQIMLNIINNSIKYNKQNGKILIKVSDKNHKIIFDIKDTGIGISREELPFIFDKFNRAKAHQHMTAGGTGLGLNIAKNLVILHGGKISAQSQLDKGTKITFSIPK